MSQRVAFLVSAILAALILLGGIGLATRIVRGEPATADADDGQGANLAADQSQEQDQTYVEMFDRLQQANTALATSYDRIASLLDRVDALQAQNAQLRAREVEYQARLAEANRRLDDQGRAAIAIPSAGLTMSGHTTAGAEATSDSAQGGADEGGEHE